jgi:hypothetical protein
MEKGDEKMALDAFKTNGSSPPVKQQSGQHTRLRRGIAIPDQQPIFRSSGGEVDRSRQDHHEWIHQGLPTVGVHCNRTVALRRLVRVVRRALSVNVAPTRQQAPRESDHLQAKASHRCQRFAVRSNPPSGHITAAPLTEDALEAIRNAVIKSEAANTKEVQA